MVCYVCQMRGDHAEGAAICMVCGVGLCREHMIREKLAVWKGVHAGMGTTRVKLPSPLPRTVCAECHQALHQT